MLDISLLATIFIGQLEISRVRQGMKTTVENNGTKKFFSKYYDYILEKNVLYEPVPTSVMKP